MLSGFHDFMAEVRCLSLNFFCVNWSAHSEPTVLLTPVTILS